MTAPKVAAHTPGREAFDAFYNDWRGKTPANAVRLAVADIEARDGGGNSDFMHALRVASRQLDAHDDLVAALQTLTAAADADGWPDGWGMVRDTARAAIAKAQP